MHCRVGAVEFLNTVPLLHGLEDLPGLDVTCDVPSALADGLRAGRYDVALIPMVSYLDGTGEAIVPGVSISCRGPVGTIKLFASRPLPEVRTLALDSGSRSSAALARAVLSARHGARPECREMAPNLGRMLDVADAAVLIGRSALLTGKPPSGVDAYDLGEMWWDWQAVPLVLATWVFRQGAGSSRIASELAAARDRGLVSLGEIAAEEAAARGIDAEIVRHYLGEMLDYTLGPAHLEGIGRYQDLLVAEHIIDQRRDLTFVS